MGRTAQGQLGRCRQETRGSKRVQRLWRGCTGRHGYEGKSLGQQKLFINKSLLVSKAKVFINLSFKSVRLKQRI